MKNLVYMLLLDGGIYLFLYLLLFILIVVEVAKEFRPYNIILLFFTSVLLFLFTGLRWETGTDWSSYKDLFDSLELDWTFLLSVYSFDLGYVLLNAFVKLFTDNYTLFLVIDSFIAIGLVYYFLRKYSLSPSISLFVFYNSFFIAQFMGSNRRMISLGAGLFVFFYVLEKSYKRYLFWQIVAFLFHRSSLILLLTWLVPRKRFTTKRIFIILFICFTIGIFQLPFRLVGIMSEFLSSFSYISVIDKMLFYYENSDNVIPENTNPILVMTLSVIKRLFFLFFYLFVINRNKGVIDRLSDYFLNVYLIGFSLYLLFNGSPIFQMLSTYFTFIEIALIGRFWQYTDIKVKFRFLPFLMFYGFVQLFSALSVYPELYIPYKLFLIQ